MDSHIPGKEHGHPYTWIKPKDASIPGRKPRTLIYLEGKLQDILKLQNYFRISKGEPAWPKAEKDTFFGLWKGLDSQC